MAENEKQEETGRTLFVLSIAEEDCDHHPGEHARWVVAASGDAGAPKDEVAAALRRVADDLDREFARERAALN